MEKGFVDFVLTPADNPELFNSEGGSALILTYMDMGSDDAQLKDRKGQVEEIIKNTKTPTGINLSVGGAPVIFSEVSKLLFNDLIVTGVLSLVIIAFSIRIFYGSNRMTIVNIFILVCAMTCIFGSMKLMEVPLNIATALIAVLTIGIGVDYTLHLQNGFAKGEGRRRYIVTETLRKIGPPLTMAFITTLIGFFSLFFAGSRVMETLAISTSLGIFYVFIFNMTLTPVIFLIFGGGKGRWGNFKNLKKTLYSKMPDFASIIGNYTFAFTLALGIFAVTAIYGITMVNTETDYSGFIPADNPIIIDMTEQADAFPGTTSTMNIIIEAEDVLEYEVLKEMDDFSKRLTGIEYVEFVRSPVDDIKEMNNGQIPETRARISHPDVGNDYKMIRMTVGYSNQIAMDNEVFYGTFIPKVSEKFPEHYDTYYAGEVAYSARENEITESGSQMVTLVSFALIFVILVIYFRSIILGVLMLLPIFLAIMSTMGINGWTGIPFSQITSSIFGIIIGLGMDFSIHSGNEMREELGRGASYAGAVEATHVHLAKLLFLTSLTTVLGFLALQFAQLSFLQDLGLTLAFGILFAFLYSVFLLPALIIVYYKVKRGISKILKIG
jgi:hydrophobe/amphiphile efflux-3 (HAE3) family protein